MKTFLAVLIMILAYKLYGPVVHLCETWIAHQEAVLHGDGGTP